MERRQQRKRRRRLLQDYLLIVSTEPEASPTKDIKSNGDLIFIPQGHVVLWSGEYTHAGAAYEVRNSRLIVAITSEESSSNLLFVKPR